MKRSQELKQKRAAVLASVKALDEKVRSDKRDTMTPDEERQWERMFEEMRSYDKSIEMAEAMEAEEVRTAGEHITDAEPATGPSVEQQKTLARKAVNNYLRYGLEGLSAEERTALTATKLVATLQRDVQSAVTANLGAEMVKEEYLSEFEKHLISDNGVMSAARIIRTQTGGDLPWPSVDDTSNVGELLGENTATAETAIPTAAFTLKAYKYSSKGILVPVELLQDDGYGFVNEIPQMAAERVSRIANTHMTTGTGTGQPQGITVGAGNSSVTITADTITRAKLLDLVHSVNPAYRSMGANGAKFMFSDATLKAIIKLSIGSSDDRPLWLPSMRDGSPSTIEGYGYVINDYMPSISSTTNRAIVFGDLSKYYVRMVKDFTIKRADELHLAKFMVGFYGFARLDGRVANSSAIKYLAVA